MAAAIQCCSESSDAALERCINGMSDASWLVIYRDRYSAADIDYVLVLLGYGSDEAFFFLNPDER